MLRQNKNKKGLNRRGFIKKASIYLALTASIGFSGCIEINLDEEDILPNNNDNQQGEEPNNEPSSGLEPPEITASLESTLKTAYIGKKPKYRFKVKNDGGECQVEGTILGQSVSGDLEKNETSFIDITLSRITDMKKRHLEVDLTAKNKAGSDSYYKGITVIPELKPYNPLDDITEEMVNEEANVFYDALRDISRRFLTVVKTPAEVYVDYYVAPDSQVVEIVADELMNRQPTNLLRTKRAYYWVHNWINYKYEGLNQPRWENMTDPDWSQVEHPAETIYDRTGVCLNYSVVLASLFGAMGINNAIIVLEDYDGSGHVINAVNLPELDYEQYNTIQVDNIEWVLLDPTNNKEFGEIKMQWIQDKYDESTFAIV